MINMRGSEAMSTVVERNRVTIMGQGEQTLVLAHGLGCNQEMWQYITPFLKESYRLISFDHVGSGQSDITAYRSEKYCTLQGYATDLVEIIEELELKDIIFVGHSISSMIGLLAAIDKPQLFKSLIMIGPSPCYVNEETYHGGFERSDISELLDMMEMNFAGWASYMAPIGMATDHAPHLTQELETAFVSTNARIAREFAEVTFLSDYRAQLPLLQVPALILQCAEDSIVPIEVGHYLHQHLTNSELVVLPVKGHYPHISQPTETVTEMVAYIEKMSVLVKGES